MKRKYFVEHFFSFTAVLLLNLLLLFGGLLNPTKEEKPIAMSVKRIEETVLIRPAVNVNPGKPGLGNLPGLQMSYGNEDALQVIKFYQMTPFILDEKDLVYQIDLEKNALIKVDSKVINQYSPRARRIDKQIFIPFINYTAESLNKNPEYFSIVLLIPKEIEEQFVEKQVEALKKNNLSPETVLVLRGKYLRTENGDYQIHLTEAITKEGNVIVLEAS